MIDSLISGIEEEAGLLDLGLRSFSLKFLLRFSFFLVELLWLEEVEVVEAKLKKLEVEQVLAGVVVSKESKVQKIVVAWMLLSEFLKSRLLEAVLEMILLVMTLELKFLELMFSCTC